MLVGAKLDNYLIISTNYTLLSYPIFARKLKTQMKKALFALSLGTFALGITEYVMMAILSEVASSLSISIPQGGHLISAYALGVAVGAPLLIVGYRFKPKSVLLFLALVMFAGAVLSVLAPNYWLFLVARFISGLPHGAYFGVASIVAVHLAPEDKKGKAVSTMIAGMTVANLMGVPVSSWLCSTWSWRFPFLITSICALLVLCSIWRWVPNMDRLPVTGFKGQFRFLSTSAPWLILTATLLGNGGVFCWYSYISPLLSQESGFALTQVPMLMIAAGAGMVLGNILSGVLSDRYSAYRVAPATQLLAVVGLILIFFLADYGWLSVVLMVVVAGCLFAVSGPEQFLILRHAPGGEMLGGACVQMAFNLGNALGAFVGGLPISFGCTPRYTALAGIPFCLLGFVCLMLLYRKSTKTALSHS